MGGFDQQVKERTKELRHLKEKAMRGIRVAGESCKKAWSKHTLPLDPAPFRPRAAAPAASHPGRHAAPACCHAGLAARPAAALAVGLPYRPHWLLGSATSLVSVSPCWRPPRPRLGLGRRFRLAAGLDLSHLAAGVAARWPARGRDSHQEREEHREEGDALEHHGCGARWGLLLWILVGEKQRKRAPLVEGKN
ncbi:hypothetical protein C2845_PM15G15470 [Panicum miliaceum]|uniref:Uncharacterized protein n=1 Tax=Panicum miliaceum TaxID=4540 RepID=A0A3L6Q852_PANMI|nr:hypothetical protein C2845_PM15G15470 [Panicum miliaceum]